MTNVYFNFNILLVLEIFSVPIPCHKSRLSHLNDFLRHYGGQLKTVVEQEAGGKIEWKITK